MTVKKDIILSQQKNHLNRLTSLRVKMIIVYICICYINTDKEGSKYAFHHNNIIFTYNFSHYLIPYEIITSKMWQLRKKYVLFYFLLALLSLHATPTA